MAASWKHLVNGQVLRKTNYAKIIGALPLNDFAPDWFTPWR
jgi:hypothetical protein